MYRAARALCGVAALHHVHRVRVDVYSALVQSSQSSVVGVRRQSGGPPSATMSGTEKSKADKARRLAKRKAASQFVRVRSGPTFHIDEAIRIVKALRKPAMDQTVDIQVQLGTDPRKTDQVVRGVAALPHGAGKRVLIAVFAKGEKAEEARAAGAHLVGAEDLVERIQKGELDFNKTIATPDMMALVGRVARVLGPRGLMPNPKLGTVTVNIKEAVAAAQRGQATFRAEKRGIVSAAVGKASFAPGALKDNIRSFMSALSESKPEGFKGVFLKAVFLSTTMGPGLPVAMGTVDPLNVEFMSTWSGAPTALPGGPGRDLHEHGLGPAGVSHC
jgi:large subunit ribosomal protein L1